MGPLGRGLGRDRHHYDRVGAGEGTLMRHFLRLARAPSALPGGVPRRSAVAQLEAFTGAVQRLTPADLGARTSAVSVAAVTVAADPHLLDAAPATVKPIRLLACPHRPHAQDWTKPRSDGIKAKRTRLHARERVEGPGFFQERARAFVYSASGNRIARARPSMPARYPRGSHRDRSLDVRLRLIQSDDSARHAQIKLETTICTRKAR